ncbi:AAA family ATPase [Profundibacter amoris]|uniref:Chromosome segregation protein SMC n=1 Tax=Profundibacter amoris TaxID=2171755 RepID=A0A347UID3_9RHOB|nr:AAA family ATPase [Profundibacter amoris]AXX98611.1 chromosome segregation protein SMC [Profundibacter amoris]
MKLLSVTLSDIRRFTKPVIIDGIGDGLNVLTAPNEYGKSTLFDALQAVFFQGLRAKSKEIMALKPHAGGAPQVEVEVETPDGRFRIIKRWLKQPMAEVYKGDRLIAKADDAEAWIAKLMHSGDAGGPAGLLWVRQGITALDQGSKKEKESAQYARQDLMSSVAGEVEALTGGRRMDIAIDRCQDDLSKYVTATGRVLKSGPLDTAEKEVASLAQRKSELEDTVRELSGAINRRREIKKALAELQDADVISGREQRLSDATKAHEDALRHADSVSRAQNAVKTATLERDAVEAKLEALQKARKSFEKAQKDEFEKSEFAAECVKTLKDSEANFVSCKADVKTAREVEEDAVKTLNAVLKAESGRSAKTRRKDLKKRINEVETLAKSITSDSNAAATGPDKKTIEKLDVLSQEVSVQQELRTRSAPQVSLSYVSAEIPRATIAGGILKDQEVVPLPDGATIDIPEFGLLTLRPGQGANDDDELNKAKVKFAKALDDLGFSTLDAAHKAANQRDEAAKRVQDAKDKVSLLAPDDLDALRIELASLPEAVEPDADLPDQKTAQVAVDAAKTRLKKNEDELEDARDQRDQDRDAAARASVLADAAQSTLEEAEAAVKEFEDVDTLERKTIIELDDAGSLLGKLEKEYTKLAAEAPDLSVSQAALDRAKSVCEQAKTEIYSLGQELAGLDTKIDLRSGEGVEEDLTDVVIRFGAAEKTLAALQFEVEVLKELAGTLDAARTAARDRYFEPVINELKPLLKLLWPDADLKFDGDRILPTALIRDGQEESIGVLSGGTQEQIALLVRLAFARLLASGGRHAPIILDDALVYTDDDRIERMFDALHRQAGDLQIIVLSCRQRAFRELGGQKLTFKVVLDD